MTARPMALRRVSQCACEHIGGDARTCGPAKYLELAATVPLAPHIGEETRLRLRRLRMVLHWLLAHEWHAQDEGRFRRTLATVERGEIPDPYDLEQVRRLCRVPQTPVPAHLLGELNRLRTEPLAAPFAEAP